MPEDVTFLPGERLRELAGEAASRVLPDELGETLPVPVRANGRTVLLVMYYEETGPPGRRTVRPPSHAMHLDGATGRVLRLWASTPEELGIIDPRADVPGAGIRDGMPWEEFAAKRDRVLALGPAVWHGYATAQTRLDAEAVAGAREYRQLLMEVTPKAVAPFYVQAAAEFFRWLDAVTGPERP
jgi:hypothetical protein